MQDKPSSAARLGRIALPVDMADTLSEMNPSNERPKTLADVIDTSGGWLPSNGPIAPSDLYQEETTRHAVHFGSDSHSVPCILDGLIVGLLAAERPVRIDSASPVDGKLVEYQISDDEVVVNPDSAVVSFGIAPSDATGLAYDDDFEANPRLASCSYINSFPNERAYERWATSTDAVAVMKLSVDEAVEAARQIAAGPIFETEQ